MNKELDLEKRDEDLGAEESDKKSDIEDNDSLPKFDNELVNEASKDALQLDNGKCGACGRTGFPIFLVRKSIVPKFFKSEINWSKNMTNLNNAREPDSDLSMHKYVYRTLREGYLYILLKKNKVDFWDGTDLNLLKVKAYEITNSGAFRLREFRDIKGSRPKELPASCITEGHHFKAKFVTIDNRIYQKAWIAYSPYQWEKDKVEFYRKNENERKLRFTEVDLLENKTSEESGDKQERKFPISDFISKNKYLLEMECDASEVIDYFDDDQQSLYRKTVLKGANDNCSKTQMEIERGVFYASNCTLSGMIENTEEEILSKFKSLFCTSSHFNSLKVGKQISSEFLSIINNYKADGINTRNKHYQTNDINVVVIEDSLGMAEELSVQRRQLLSPILSALTESNEDQVKAIKNKLQIILDNKNDEIKKIDDIILGDVVMSKNVNAEIAEAFYSENILDLQQNQRYRYFRVNNDELRFGMPPALWLQNKISEGRASIEGPRAKVVANYFSEQISLSKTKPLLYFKSETSYARRQHKSIEEYKNILRSNSYFEDAGGCLIFAFYGSPNTVQDSDRFHAVRMASEYLVNKPFTGGADKEFLDNILVYNAIGFQEFAIDNGYTIVDPACNDAGQSDYQWHFFFRYVSEKGGDRVVGKPPLGDYHIVDITPDQKSALLELYLKSSEFRMNDDDVVVVYYPEAKQRVADWKVKTKWNNKEGKRTYTDSIELFEKLDKVTYDNLLNYVKSVSSDYYLYLSWLFDKDNNVQFWLKENDPDTSDIHINVLSSLLLILDSSYLGSAYIKEDMQLWSKLISYPSSIYNYLIEGNQYTLFNIASGDIPDEDSQLTEEVKAILAENIGVAPKKKNAKVKNALSIPIDAMKKYKKFVKNIKIKENVTVGAFLKEELIKLSLSNFSKALPNGNTTEIEREMIKKTLMKSMNMFSTGLFKEYKVSLPVSKIPLFLNNLGDSAPLVLPDNGRLITSAGNLVDVNRAVQGGYNISSLRQANTSNQSVEFTMILTFADKDEMDGFEKKLISSRGFAKPEKFIGTKVVTLDELVKIRYKEKQKWAEEVYDSSVSGVMNLFTLVYQGIQIHLLNEKLSDLNSPVLIQKLKEQMSKAYTSIALTAIEAVINSLKLYVLFTEKNKSYYDLLKMAGKGLGYVGKTLALIDSFSQLCQASSSLSRGNTGSVTFMICSTISFVTAGLAFFIGLPFLWVVALALVPYAIAWLFGKYDDASSWDAMDKWVNRTIFGRLDFGDIYPPYPITDTGLYLSNQDYYLASRHASCEMVSNTQYSFTALSDDKKLIGADSKNRFINLPACNDDKSYPVEKYIDLYVDMSLPGFILDKSKFEGTVIIRHAKTNSEVRLSFSDGKDSIILEPSHIRVDYFVSANDKMSLHGNKLSYTFKKDDLVKVDEKTLEKKKKIMAEWLAMQDIISDRDEAKAAAPKPIPDQLSHNSNNVSPQQSGVGDKENIIADENSGLFLVIQHLGRMTIDCDVFMFVKYWPEGFMDNKNQTLFPLLLSCQYETTKSKKDAKN